MTLDRIFTTVASFTTSVRIREYKRFANRAKKVVIIIGGQSSDRGRCQNERLSFFIHNIQTFNVVIRTLI
jgi:hypothetical protein